MANYKNDDRREAHYTVKELIDGMFEMLQNHKEPITEFLENSAGDGRLIDALKEKYPDTPVLAYDIHDEGRSDIHIIKDYMKEKIEYKKGRVTFINPPFAKGLKFVYKVLKESDYVVSILSINSFINIDYDKYIVDEIYIYRKVDFGSCKVNVCIIGIRNKK